MPTVRLAVRSCVTLARNERRSLAQAWDDLLSFIADPEPAKQQPWRITSQT
jgi:hypothetical protein